MADKREYMIDVAGERRYQGQGRDYYNAYTSWRNDAKNKYAYRFVHDKREHIYIDGEGYADKRAVNAEKQALHSCISFLGGSMLVLFIFQLARFLVMRYVFNSDYIGWVYYSESSKALSAVPDIQAYVYLLLRLLSLVTVLIICAVTLRIPRKIALPLEKPRAKLVACGLCISLVFLIISRVFDYILVQLFMQINVDVSFYYYLHSHNNIVRAVYYLNETILSSVLIEMIFRGYILQLFRQFGDLYAIIVSSLASAFCYHDITNIMFMFALGVILGMITIINGSIGVTVFTRMVIMNLSFLLNSLSVVYNDLPDRFIEAMICIVITAAGIYSLRRLTAEPYEPLRLSDPGTEMTLAEKMKQLLNSNLFLLFLTASMIAVVMSVRFI